MLSAKFAPPTIKHYQVSELSSINHFTICKVYLSQLCLYESGQAKTCALNYNILPSFFLKLWERRKCSLLCLFILAKLQKKQ